MDFLHEPRDGICSRVTCSRQNLDRQLDLQELELTASREEGEDHASESIHVLGGLQEEV